MRAAGKRSSQLRWSEIFGLAHRGDAAWDRIRYAQIAALLKLAPIAVVANTVGSALLVWLFWHNFEQKFLIAWAAIIFFGSGEMWRAYSSYYSGNRLKGLATTGLIWKSAAQAFLLALLWAIPPVLLFPIASPAQQLAICVITTAMMAGASLIYSSTGLAGLAYLLPLAVASGVIVSGVESIQLFTSLLIYVICLIFGIIANGRELVEQHLADMEISEKDDVISLLLREYDDRDGDWLWETDAEGALINPTPRAERAFGLTRIDVEDRHLIDLLTPSNRPDDFDPQHNLRMLDDHMEGHLSFNKLVVPVIVHDQHRLWQMSARPLYNERGTFKGFRGVGSDITDARRQQDQISRMARYDTLTGLPNRSYATERLAKALSAPTEESKASAALLLVDLDRFKMVNDTLGHPVGDKLLCEVSRRLEAAVGDIGTIGRLGGDEFAVIVEQPAKGIVVEQLAASLIDALSRAYQIDGHQIVIGASIGIAFAPRDGENVDMLVRSADLALYAAKDAGKGLASSYMPSMRAEAEERRQLEMELREAIANNGLSLGFQPIVSSITNVPEGFEAVLSWHHPALGEIDSARFLPIAQEAGLISALGVWVIRNACAEATRWPEHVRVSVSLSALQFAAPDLANMVVQTLRDVGLSPARLELEIGESVLMKDDEAVLDTMARLSAAGVRVAFGDFGTGYSSLGYLRTAAFNAIKLDPAFVRSAAAANPQCVAILRAIVALSESLGMTIIAEGADTEIEIHAMRTLGCTEIQTSSPSALLDADTAALLVQANDTSCVNVA